MLACGLLMQRSAPMQIVAQHRRPIGSAALTLYCAKDFAPITAASRSNTWTCCCVSRNNFLRENTLNQIELRFDGSSLNLWAMSFPRRRESNKACRVKMNKYYIYMITNRNNNVLYIGVTNDLKRRVFEHREKLVEGFI